MALSSGNKVAWSDIQAIYTKLNNCQTKFSITTTAAPANPGKCTPETMTTLKNFIFAMSSNALIGTSNVSAVFNLANARTGDLLKADPFNTMSTTLDTVYNLCVNFSDFGDRGNRSNRSNRSDFGGDLNADGYYSGFSSGSRNFSTCTRFKVD